jgi:U3 small nucleolar RNA-associated protein 10
VDVNWYQEIFDIDILVQCVADASDTATRNQALMLLTAIARIFPQKVLNHIVDLFSVIGASTITQVCFSAFYLSLFEH